MKYVMDKTWLADHLKDSNVRIVDCRFSLSAPERGKQEYEAGHLPGAVFFDLEKDLSSPITDHGGRHPLPALQEFTAKLGAAGIDQSKTVIAYDYGEGAFAARFWWLLQYLGHERVYVLNGGFKHWQEAGLPVTTEVPAFEKVRFHVTIRPELLATMNEVKAKASGKREDIILIDSREEKRYLGLEEPIDKKAGHIPGAINKPWMEGLFNGYYQPVSKQEERFAELNPEKEIIVYCGSGVTATPNFLALMEAGFKKVKLYAGSFSDWISYEENDVE